MSNSLANTYALTDVHMYFTYLLINNPSVLVN